MVDTHNVYIHSICFITFCFNVIVPVADTCSTSKMALSPSVVIQPLRPYQVPLTIHYHLSSKRVSIHVIELANEWTCYLTFLIFSAKKLSLLHDSHNNRIYKYTFIIVTQS